MARISDKSTEELLEMILYYIQRMEKRDRWRTIGGTFRSLITLIPVFFVIASGVYFYYHGQDFIKNVTSTMLQEMTSFMPGAPKK